MARAVEDMKECCRCKETKPTTEFNKRNRTLDGFEYFCKSCAKIAYDKNREKHREYDLKHYQKHRERRLVKSALYRNKKFGNKIPEHLVPHLNWERKVSMSHEEAVNHARERLRQYKASNNEKFKEKYKIYQQGTTAKELGRLKAARYRTKKKENGDDFITRDEIDFLLILQNGECACCGNAFTDRFKYELDHIIPVSLGGNLSMENVQLLCRSCNARKKNTTVLYRPNINFRCLSFI